MEAIRQHPGRFLDFKSLTALYHFIMGARMVIGDGKAGDPAWFNIPADFIDWVACRTRHHNLTRGWRRLIIADTTSEEKAYDRFFQLLEEYHTRVPTVIAEITGAPPPERESWEEEAPPPDPALIVKFTDDPGFFIQHQTPYYRQGYCFCWKLTYMGSFKEGTWDIRDHAAYEKILREDVTLDLQQVRAASFSKNVRMEPSPTWWNGTHPYLQPGIDLVSDRRHLRQSASAPFPTLEEAIARSKIPRSSHLHSIRRIPHHTLDCKSLTALHHYIAGYHHALDCHPGHPYPRLHHFPGDFTHWVAQRLHFPDPTIGWCSMILRTSANEEAAFDRFFDLLEDYYSH